jgi:DNA-binding NarL/FixJ family response regulator
MCGVYGKPSKVIRTLAVVGGSGGDYLPDAQRAHADALLTGEVRHHHTWEAWARDVVLLEGGHAETEQPGVVRLGATATRVPRPAQCGGLRGGKRRMKAYRVLIVDDEPVIRLDLRTMLEAMGHEVVGEADNGADALQLARTLQPDLVIADLMMPEMDGIELSRRLAKERIAPVLVLTAYSEPEMVMGADRAGVLGYLVKPFREADLAPAIQVAISRYRELRALEAQNLNLAQEIQARRAHRARQARADAATRTFRRGGVPPPAADRRADGQTARRSRRSDPAGVSSAARKRVVEGRMARPPQSSAQLPRLRPRLRTQRHIRAAQ